MPPPLSADPPVIVTRVSDRFPPGPSTSGRQVPGQNRKRAPRHGDAAQPGHHHPAAGRSRQHRRRQPPPRPRPATHALAASGSVNDFAVSLVMDRRHMEDEHASRKMCDEPHTLGHTGCVTRSVAGRTYDTAWAGSGPAAVGGGLNARGQWHITGRNPYVRRFN